MDIIKALAPAFAAGFAIQQLLEIITSFLDLRDDEPFQKYKKPILGFVSLVVGFSLAFGVGELHILTILLTKEVTDAAGKVTTVTPQISSFLDALVTGLVISAGTEGINSILKFLKYTKEDKKNQAAVKTPSEGGTRDTRDSGARGSDNDEGGETPSNRALTRMNRQ